MEVPIHARWWEDAGLVEHRLAGVFEGGGAKGVAYAGALEATLAKHCWFGAVAGASAGAITAALIAAGLNPTELKTESSAAFERLRIPAFGAGLQRLRLNFGFLDNVGIREWLEGRLAAQIALFGVDLPGPVTFAQLYQATEIELNVVAADLSRGRQIVFSVWDTPSAQVTDAVLASSSIPFAFPAGHLRVPVGETAYVHTLVDGGVWSNFPTFVFRDHSFRRASGRPEMVAEDYVVGYLLDEQGEDEPKLTDSSFVGLDDQADPREWRVPHSKNAPRTSSVIRRIGQAVGLVLLSPLWLPLRFGAWLSLGGDRAWRGRWPATSGAVGWVLGPVGDALSALHSAWLAGVAALAVVGGTIAACYWLVTSFLLLRIEEAYFDAIFQEPAVANDILQIVLVTLIIVLLLVVMMLVLLALAANYVMLGPMRQVIYGVVRTYAAGPGAPAWAGTAEDDHVIRLPIPRQLTTFSFRREAPGTAEAVEQAIQDARAVSEARLDQILARPPTRGPRRPPPPVLGGSAQPVASPSHFGIGGPALALRLSIVAIVAGFAVFLASFLLPKPAWYAYDVNVRICAEAITTPQDACDRPTRGSAVATAIFGPASAGHVIQATMTANGTVVARTGEEVLESSVWLVPFDIDVQKFCGFDDCTVTVSAFVDGKRVFRKTIDLRTEVDIHG